MTPADAWHPSIPPRGPRSAPGRRRHPQRADRGTRPYFPSAPAIRAPLPTPDPAASPARSHADGQPAVPSPSPPPVRIISVEAFERVEQPPPDRDPAFLCTTVTGDRLPAAEE